MTLQKMNTTGVTLLFCFLLPSMICFSQKDSTNITVTIKLIKAEPPTPPCGTIAWAIIHKAEILESAVGFLNPHDTILLLQSCPELFKIGYLKTNQFYRAIINKNSGAKFDYTITGELINEKLPKYWIRKIEGSDR